MSSFRFVFQFLLLLLVISLFVGVSVQQQAPPELTSATEFVLARSVIQGCDNCGKSWDSTTLGRARNCSTAATADLALSRNERSRTVWLRSFPWPESMPNGSRIVDVELRIGVRATGAMNFTNCNLHLSGTAVRPFACQAAANSSTTVAAGGAGRDYTLTARAAVGTDLTGRHLRNVLFGVSFAFVSVFDSRVVSIRCGLARAIWTNESAPTSVSTATSAPAPPPAPTSTDARCANLPRGTLELPAPISCVADLDSWRVDCPNTAALPSAREPFVELGDVTLRLARCPTVSFELGFDFELHIESSTIKAALQSRGIAVPAGSQRVTLTKPVSQIELELPVWPLSGIVDIPGTAITPAARVGLAIAIKNVKLEAARLSLTAAARVCNGRPTCTDIALGTVQYGNNDACCLSAALQCDAEVAQCSPTTTRTTAAAIGASSVQFVTDQFGATVTDANGVPITVAVVAAAAADSSMSCNFNMIINIVIMIVIINFN